MTGLVTAYRADKATPAREAAYAKFLNGQRAEAVQAEIDKLDNKARPSPSSAPRWSSPGHCHSSDQPAHHYLGALMNRKIGRRTGIALGVLLAAVALGLTWFAFQVSMDAVRAVPDLGAVGHSCR